MNTPSTSGSSDGSSGAVQEFPIKVPKNGKKNFHVMRFNGTLNIDFTKWSQVKLEREDNLRAMRAEEEMPKFGAGSEFGREAKEEARRKKYGIAAKKYKPEDQPWILRSGGKTGKKFKGVREGGVGDNSSYYVFTHGPDGSIEAFPLNEWYNFQPIQRYKALSAEEAEEEFGRRNKVMNYFSLMLQKRLKNTEDGEPDEGEELLKGTKKKNKEKDLKISDMDEWMDSDIDDSSDDDEDKKKDDDDEDASDKRKKKKKKDQAKKNAIAKKKKKGSDESALEESDDGDEEGRELDYISDSSEDVSDHDEKARKELKGVTEEKALRKLLNSDEEDDEDDDDEEEKKKSDPEDADQDEPETPTKEKKKKKAKDKKKNNKETAAAATAATEEKVEKNEKNEESSSLSSDSSGDESKKKVKQEATNTPSSQDSNAKRAIAALNSSQESSAKKPRLDNINYNDSGISEEAVRRYLIRKPMTATELLQKFKRPKTNLSSEQLVTVMTSILKRINPTKQTIKNKMYLSLKPS